MKFMLKLISSIGIICAYLAVYYEIGMHCNLANTIFYSFIFTAVATWLIVYLMIEFSDVDDYPHN